MKQTISIRLFKTLQRGIERLDKQALDRIMGFVESQRTEEASFVDKSGKADLYYTVFGWTLAYLLGLKLDIQKARRYLSEQNLEALDLIHYAAFVRCRMILTLMENGTAGWLFDAFRSFVGGTSGSANKTIDGSINEKFGSVDGVDGGTSGLVNGLTDGSANGSVAQNMNRFVDGQTGQEEDENIQRYSGLPHNDPLSPYTQFIRLCLLEDNRHPIRHKKEIITSLSRYRVPTGGYMNTTDGLTATTNATAAALAVTGQLAGYQNNADVRYLQSLQKSSGGFCAAEATPVPDLLSTATALFVLNSYGLPPKHDASDFIEAHWLDSGGFSATLLENKSDVEYTFYGLLALSASQK